MVVDFIDYIKQNQGNLIKDVIFIFISYFVTVLLSPKSNHVMYQTSAPPSNIEIINRQRTQKVVIVREKKAQGNSANQSDNSIPIIFAFLGLLASYLFVRYHEIIMNSLFVLILMGLTATITVTYRLSVTGVLDTLSKWWLFLSFVVWIASGYMLLELSNTKFSSIDTSSVGNYLNSVGIDGAGKFLYQGLGTFAICLPILISLSILIHLFALTSYRAREGRISSFFIRMTQRFVTSPMTTSIVIIALCGVSIFYVSGAAYNLVVKSNPFETFKGR